MAEFVNFIVFTLSRCVVSDLKMSVIARSYPP